MRIPMLSRQPLGSFPYLPDSSLRIPGRLLFGLIAFFLVSQVMGQDRSAAFALNQKLGRGINLGNMFEAPTESGWGNPYRPDYFRRIASLGFKHVRIPVRWDTPERTMLSAPYTVSPTFLNRLKGVIDDAHQQGLYVIINMHHHEELFSDPEKIKPRFLSQWTQIAGFFKEYDDRLLFEVLNEPHGGLTPERWNQYFAESLAIIRQTNPTRMVVMGMPLYGGLAGVPYLQLPEDPYLIVSPHYYNPFRFTHQGAGWAGNEASSWLGTPWRGLQAEREEVMNEFEAVIRLSKEKNVPVHVGEFGTYHKADLDSRVRWSNFLARWFEEQGFSWAYWEFSAGFGVFNPATGQYLQPLVDALTVSPMLPPTPVFGVAVYSSDFTSSTDGWNLYVQPTASASLRQGNAALNVAIDRASTEAWHVQLVRNSTALAKGQLYRVSFKASASSPRPITSYVGKASSPHTAYSGPKSLTLGAQEREFAYVFEMTSESDPAARIVFDLGTAASAITVSSVRLEKLYLQVTGVLEESEYKPILSPNPATDEVLLTETKDFSSLRLYNVQGHLLQTLTLDGRDTFSLPIRNLPAGLYLIVLEGAHRQVCLKLVK